MNDLKPATPKFTAEELASPIYEFRLNYIVALKIALLNYGNLRPEIKMYQLLAWMEDDFIMCAPALQYTNLLFSPSRKKGMLKNRLLQNIRNMAWDFALVTYWRRLALKGNKSDHPVLLVSGDHSLIVPCVCMRCCGFQFHVPRTGVRDGCGAPSGPC